jgi:hypothetical protein
VTLTGFRKRHHRRQCRAAGAWTLACLLLFAPACATTTGDPGGDLSFAVTVDDEYDCATKALFNRTGVTIETTDGMVIFCGTIACTDWGGVRLNDFARGDYVLRLYGVAVDESGTAGAPVAYAEKEFTMDFADVDLGTLVFSVASATIDATAACTGAASLGLAFVPREARVGSPLWLLLDANEQCGADPNLTPIYTESPVSLEFVPFACEPTVKLDAVPIGTYDLTWTTRDAQEKIVGQALQEVTFEPGLNAFELKGGE